MSLHWNETLNVNIRVFNNHHKMLINLTNELEDAMLTGNTRSVIGKTLKSLSEYTIYHFGEEEKLMVANSYQDFTIHKLQHDEFVKEVLECITKYEAGRITVSIELLSFLTNWLKNHIMGTDKGYSQFFNAKGLR